MSRPPLVLVVDDDPAIRGGISAELATAGYRTAEAADGEEAMARLDLAPDLIVTDLVMPGIDGFALIRTVRRDSRTPILVLSVHGAESEKIRALDAGADDFVVKPFSVPELLARVRAQLRRSAPPRELRFPELAIDLERRTVQQSSREVKLTPTEFALLELLASNAGKPLPFRRIIDRVWSGAPGTTKDTVRVHVASLRRKLEPDPSSPRYIVTEPWIGYRFIAEPL